MRVLVTGAGGFIGSHLTRRLLDSGHEVVGVDKRISSANPLDIPVDIADLTIKDWRVVIQGIDVIYHLAGLPGVRSSWGASFEDYLQVNVSATQKLLEASVGVPLKKWVFASSSSVYGLTKGATTEESPVLPISPYGVSKLAAEQLVRAYAYNFNVPTTSLRFFTVYGPGQRPDMAFHRFFKAILQGQEITLYGDGRQTRDFTYIDDIINSCIQAMNLTEHGQVFNIGGGQRISILQVLKIMEEITELPVSVQYQPKQAGDPPDTWADISKAKSLLGLNPSITIEQGLRNQWAYIQKLYG